MTKTYPLKVHGGKSYLADWIISLMPPHVHYVEPYFGGGAVLFRKPYDGISEVANDLNGDLQNFWNVLKTPTEFRELERALSLTPFSQPEWTKAVWASLNQPSDIHKSFRGRVASAINFFIRYRQSRQGLGTSFATLSKTRTRSGMNEQVSSWLAAIDSFQEAHARLRRVVILSKPALDVIRSEDSPQTLFYCDPPYLSDTRSAKDAYGPYEMTADDHCLLLDTLARIKGKFLLSGYPSLLYHRLAKGFDFNRHSKRIDNKASGSRSKQIKTECLWCNF